MARNVVRKGDAFGAWSTLKRLGSGGNGTVWKARNARGELGAIKVFAPSSDPGRERLARFRDEISFLTSHADYPGVLPLIDSNLEDNQHQPPWYVMPIANPMTRALGRDPQPRIVLTALLAIAETLEALAADGIGHRDIKPDNLFELKGEWLIGDFGLVTYPEKDPVTRQGRRLGPIDYLAPEMRKDADTAQPEPADVWAFSKTLWVLLTGESAPLPGPHRPTDPAYSLQARITYECAGELDLLLERATRIDPEGRESMNGFVRELHACLAAPPEAVASSSLRELQDRITALTLTDYEQVSQSQDWTRRVDQVYSGLAEVLDGALAALAELLPSFSNRNINYDPDSHLLELPDTRDEVAWGHWSQSRQLISPGLPRADVTLSLGTLIQQKDGPIDIAAALRVAHPFDRILRVRTIWSTHYNAPIGSAQLARVFTEIQAGFRTSFTDALRWIAQILAGHTQLNTLPDGRFSIIIHPRETEESPPPGTAHERPIE